MSNLQAIRANGWPAFFMYDFWKICPSGNPTILLRAEDFETDRITVSTQIMNDLHLGAEQVGFIHMPDAPAQNAFFNLEMMGGEFCLNATRAFALLLAQRNLLPEIPSAKESAGIKTWTGEITSSGVNHKIEVQVKAFSPDASPANFCSAYHVSATLPMDEITLERLGEVWQVKLPGICHLITMGKPPSKSDIVNVSCQMISQFELGGETAVGCMWLAESSGKLNLHPVIWVRDTDSFCQESACGSGTLACALILHQQRDDMKIAIYQPSGYSLDVEFSNNDKRCQMMATVGGPAFIIAAGKTCLPPKRSS